MARGDDYMTVFERGINEARDCLVDLQDDLDNEELRANGLEAERDDLEIQVSDLEARVAELEDELRELEKEHGIER